MTAPRVGIVGPRRVRQGLGPFVARFLREAGADVVCFLATSEASRAAAHRTLRDWAGVQAQGYLDLAAMLDAERLDALAIQSPHEAHLPALEAALDAGLHVLCDKPLVWGAPAPVADTRRLVHAYAARGRLLWENCQWPYTLPAYAALHPGTTDRPPERFEMLLSPTAPGAAMVADSLPHPLSLLQALAPAEDAGLDGVAFAAAEAAPGGLIMRCRYRAGSRVVDVRVRLIPTAEQPRPAAYALDGRWARRRIRMPDYVLALTDGERMVDLPDPLECLVRDFVRALQCGGANDDAVARGWRIVQRSEMLEYVRTAVGERDR